MRKVVSMLLVLVIVATFTTGCGNVKKIKGVTYDTYGLLNKNEKENPEIQYEVIWGNVFWAIILSETIIAPIYFFGFSLFEPVGPKSNIKGQVVK